MSRALRSIAVGASLFFLQSVGSVHAATPSSGAVTTASPAITYSGGPFDSTNQTGTPDTPAGAGNPPLCLDPALPCDDFDLAVTIAPTESYYLRVDLSFARAAADFDLFLYNAAGDVVDRSAGPAGDQESVQILAPPNTNHFTVRVIPYDVTTGAGGDVYTAAVTLVPVPIPPEPPVPPTVPGLPRYENYAAPPSLGNGAGEPTLGVNFDTGRVMYIAGLETLRVGFDDCVSPARATWDDVSYVTTSTASLDPILFTDSRTNRTFASQLTGACSAVAFTDDDGATWTPSQGCGTPAGADHQTIGGGPFPASDPIGPTTSYPDAVYYCSQSIVTAFCALSRNGGLTFGAGVPAYSLADCGGIHGHIKVAPDGTAYVPNKSCGDPATAAVIVSENSGTTWSVRPVTGSTAPFNDVLVDPSVGVGAQGRVYFGYQRNDGHPWIAVSDDRGLTWHDNQDVGAALGIQRIVFPAVVAGANNRAAFAFLGTTTAGDYEDPNNFHGAWHLYVAHTYDGGVTWTTVNATPNDPVHRGSICNEGTGCSNVPDDRNLLDFIDVQIDAAGRVVVAYADGCVTPACIQRGINDYTAKATIARQSGGRRLTPQFDPVEPGVPRAPELAGKRIAPGVIHLTWTRPDNGGADLTEYRIYRGTVSGGETFLTSTTAKGTYDDITADPATGYYYRIRAVNAAGEGPFCGEVFVPAGVPPGTDPCFTPGVTVSVDVGDGVPNLPPNAAVDLKSASVAEPYGVDGSPKLVFTIQVGEAAAAPPSSQWYVIWNRTNPDSGADRNYVAMKTNASGAIAFEHGTVSPPNANVPTRAGAADDGSYDAATGTIRITVSNAKVDGVTAGQILRTLHARAFFARPDGLPVTQSSSSDFSAEGDYTLVGNASCRPNAPPRSELTRQPSSGCVPLAVAFDGSASVDPDAGDTIASYQFDFGDGSPAVVQAGPTIQHTYSVEGTFGARLLVTDSRGKISQNVDLEETVVDPCPIGEALALVWSGAGKDTLSWGAVADASMYRVVRGVVPDLPKLLDASVDSCVRFEGAATTTGPTLTEVPPAGTTYWYLTLGMRGPVAGSAGNATAGPRVVDSGGTCP